MARQKPGYTVVSAEFPDALLEDCRKEAERRGVKLSAWIVATCAKRLKVAYEPPALGRPKKPAAPAK